MTTDPILDAINSALQGLGYTTKLSTAEQVRAEDEPNLPMVLVSSIKRPEINWITCGQVAAGRLYRLILVEKSQLEVSAPLGSLGIQNQFKLDVLAAFQGISGLYSGTPAWDSHVIDDQNFDASKALIAYNYSPILVSVDCLEVGALG